MYYLTLCRLSNYQIFHYTSCTTPKRVTSLHGPSPRHCARATLILSKKCRSGGEPLATLMCFISSARDSNVRPPAPETNASPLDQLAGQTFESSRYITFYHYCAASSQIMLLRAACSRGSLSKFSAFCFSR